MLLFAVVVVLYLYFSVDYAALVVALRQANAFWLLVAFSCALLSYVGAALPVVAYTEIRLSLWHTVLVQVAASVISLIAPAGLGPVALNLRFLTQHKIPVVTAVATLTFIQFTQFFSTVALLGGIFLISVLADVSFTFPETNVVSAPTVFNGVTLGVLLAFIVFAGVILLVIPVSRRWVHTKITLIWRQTRRHLQWVLTSPKRLFVGVSGSLLITVSYVAAFGFTLLAFQRPLNVLILTLIYLAATTIGSAVPSPGGIGPIEGALLLALTLVHVPVSIALSSVVVFRLLTFYLRIPLGWLALHSLQKRQLI